MTATLDNLSDPSALIKEQAATMVELIGMTRKTLMTLDSLDAGEIDKAIASRGPLVEHAVQLGEKLHVAGARLRADLAPGFAEVDRLVAELKLLDEETMTLLVQRRRRLAEELYGMAHQSRANQSYATSTSGPRFQDREA